MIQKSYRASEIILEEKPYWEDVIDGVTLSKYRIKEVPSKAWKGYEVEMINKEGQRIFYSAHIAENDEGSMSIFEPEDAEGYFPIDGDTTATVLKAEDFDRAIRISNEGGYALELQHDGGAADETGQYRYWIESYYIWSNEMFEVEDVLE